MPVWRALIVDDDPQIGPQARDLAALQDEGSAVRLEISSTERFDEALRLLESEIFDLLVMDVRLGQGASDPDSEIGVLTLREVQTRRFIPTVFYTGLPRLVNHLSTPLIRVVEKTEGVGRLLAVLHELIETKLPKMNRAILAHIQMVQAEYMWSFVADHWSELASERDGLTLAYLLARRLSTSLSGSQISKLAEALGYTPAALPAVGKAHPAEYYVMPPLAGAPSLAGDIHRLNDGQYRVLVTPSCDLVLGKNDFVLWAKCISLPECDEYRNWASDQSKEKFLSSLLRNNRAKQPERYFFLPGSYTVPDLVVDFEQLSNTPCTTLEQSTRIASLDSPFAELMLFRFARFFGRLGTPDLDVPIVVARLKSGLHSDAEPPAT